MCLVCAAEPSALEVALRWILWGKPKSSHQRGMHDKCWRPPLVFHRRKTYHYMCLYTVYIDIISCDYVTREGGGRGATLLCRVNFLLKSNRTIL
ncbi:hypothetical protein AB205_0157510 [Aquarana catesbeiana]|uniref:Uncharacterized protein n=1 Tax=Aquarana catesbeiana TaxID=8400 RepID=A0A2G9QI89_AQUCT|nr:hypothetical protein AB205_0157510 [Aquarana catesbeiana]